MNTEALSESSALHQPSLAKVSRTSLRLALSDVGKGFVQWRIWFSLAWQDIRLRYCWSQLGPFWITISMAVTISGMAFLYGYLFKINISEYLPFLAAGMLLWNLCSALITEGTQVFLEAEHYLKQIKIPYTGVILRVLIRNFIIFAHNLLIMVPVVLFFPVKVTAALLLFIPALLLLGIAAFAYVFILAIISARYRDITQMVNSIVQIVFFVTPIMWSAKVLPAKFHLFVDLNPVANFIELLRAPMLGAAPSLQNWLMCGAISIIGLAVALLLLVRFRKRIIFWV